MISLYIKNYIEIPNVENVYTCGLKYVGQFSSGFKLIVSVFVCSVLHVSGRSYNDYFRFIVNAMVYETRDGEAALAEN